MKKLLRYGDCFVLLAAIMGCLLRLWFQNAGVDSKGLYDPTHPSWLLLCLLSAGTVAFLWFLTRTAGTNPRFEDNFRPTLVGTGTYLLLAVVLAYTSVKDLLDAGKFLDQITAIAGMLAAIMLAVTGIERFGGHRPAVFLHLFPCGYFALRLFLMGRELGTEPEICTFLFGFFSALCLIPAFYYLWAFDMNQANRQHSLFWSLTAAYFSLVTTFESTENWVLHMVFAAFLLSNLCLLKPLDMPEEAPAGEETSTEQAAPAAEEMPHQETVFPLETPPAPPEAPAEGHCEEDDFSFFPPPPPVPPQATMRTDIDPETDMDAFLADLRSFLEAEGGAF